MHLQQRLKKKEEGAPWSQATHSAKHWFLWEQELLCEAGATSRSLRPMDPGHCPAIVFVWPTFLLSHSLSLAPSVPGNNTHCHRREKKRRTHSIWAELNHEAQKCPGNGEPAFCAKDHSHHVVSGLASYHFLKQVMSISELSSCTTHTRHRTDQLRIQSSHA